MVNPSVVSNSPPKAPPIKYTAHHGTRWEKEKAAAVAGAFDYPDDAAFVGPWIMGETVGKGASGRVKIARHRVTGQLAAVKILPLQPLLNSRASLATLQAKHEKARLGVDREITMMKLLHHPNVMRIYDVYEGKKELYLVLEYVSGGELFDFLVNRGRLPPLEALAYFKQIVYGLSYAHAFSIIHRDLKPENILIASLDPPLIKIADWGMAAFAPPSLQLETSCGSPHYASPEIVNGARYEGGATDIWSCGVILYALLTGRLPFDDKDVRALLMKVKAGKYDMPTHIDPMARDLLQRMLVVDVGKRITIPQILQHPWMQLETPGIVYVPAPPVLDLARPVKGVDRDLLASLMVIWGRSANREEIKADLLSVSGGNLAKAFYFLLGLYRDRTMREGGIINDGDEEEEGKQVKEGRRVTKQYTTPGASDLLSVHGTTMHKHQSNLSRPTLQINQPQARSAHVSSPLPIVKPTRARPQSTPMPNYSGCHHARLHHVSISGSGNNDGDCDYDQLTRPESRKSSAMAPSTATALTTPASSQNTGSDTVSSFVQARSSITVAPRAPILRTRTEQPQPARENIWEPVPMQCDSPPRSPVARFRYSAAPIVSTSPHSAYAQAHARGRAQPQAASTHPHSQCQTHSQYRNQNHHQNQSDEAMSICDTSMRDACEEPLPLLRAPRVTNQEFQRTIDILTEKVNGLAGATCNGNERFRDKENENFPGNKHASRINRNTEDKENDEFVYVAGSGPSITNTPRTRQSQFQIQEVQSQGQQPVHAYSPANFVLPPEEEQRGFSNAQDVAKAPIPLTGGLFAKRPGLSQDSKDTKEGKREKRGRALTIDLPGNHLRRFALSSPNPGSPGPLGSPAPSPVVGEFKGWFSNLFNWKAQTYVLCSTNDIIATRNETTRLLEILGVVVALEDGGQLRCRVGDGMSLDGMDAVQVQKHTRFRVELHASLAFASHSHSTAQSSSFSRSPLPTPTFGSGSGAPKQVAGTSQCIIVLTQEKGTVSTFRTVCRRLREEWTLDELQSPPPVSPGVQKTQIQNGENVKMIV